MNLKSLFPSQHKDPATLLRLYVATAVISIATIVLLSGYSFFRIFSDFVLKSAEVDSIQLCHLLRDQASKSLFIPIQGQGERIVIDRMKMTELDHTMRMLSHPFDIIKIKIYDAEYRIIYSTETSLIGRTDQKNRRLKNALAGNIDSMKVTKENARDLADEPLMHVDVVETYVPIRSANVTASILNQQNVGESGKVLGSFEIYMNVTKYRDQIRTGTVFMTAITIAVLAAVFGFSYALIRHGTMQLKETQSRLEVLAITDKLTGIANRGYVMSRGEEELERARRKKTKPAETSKLCCIMLDIDHFKNVNDTKGHPAGDVVLQEVVNRVQKNIRPYDIIGRYGGEEFLLLLPDTMLEEGVAVAERIRNAIRSESFSICGDEIRVSISLGITVFDDNDKTIDDLLKRADEGLYKAKNAGRDRVEMVYTPLTTELST